MEVKQCGILVYFNHTSMGAQGRRAAQSCRIGENRRMAQSRRAGPMSPCHVIVGFHRRAANVYLFSFVSVA